MVIESMDYSSGTLMKLIQLEGLACRILIEQFRVKLDEPLSSATAVESNQMFGRQLKDSHAIPLVGLELHVIRSQFRSGLGRPNPQSIVSRKINVSQLVPNTRLEFIRLH